MILARGLALLAPLWALSCQSPAPEPDDPYRLDSDPAVAGLVIVDVRMEFRERFDYVPLTLESGTLLSIDSGGRWRAGARDGLLVFDGLPPGIYLIEKVRSEDWKPEGKLGNVNYTDEARRNLTFPRRAGFEFMVEPGGITFVGPLVARNGRGRTDVLVDWLEDPTAEGRALRRVLELYPESSWTPLLRERLDEVTR